MGDMMTKTLKIPTRDEVKARLWAIATADQDVSVADQLVALQVLSTFHLEMSAEEMKRRRKEIADHARPFSAPKKAQ